MKYWKDLVNSGSLGTAKAPVRWASLPPFINEKVGQNENILLDAEDEFLALSSLARQYRIGGFIPHAHEGTTTAAAQNEVNPYTSGSATSLFKLIASEDVPALTRLWIAWCQRSNRIAEPDILTELLDLGVKHKELRASIKSIGGKRGEWIAQLNPAWQVYGASEDTQARWHEGTPDERRQLLKEVRATDPSNAIDLLKSTWDAEGANEKAAFLEILRVRLGASDLPWLESLKEKSQKVTGIVLDLLQSIPGSAVVEKYQTTLKGCVQLKTGKALLGILNKTTVEINDQFVFPDDLFKTGIDKLSSDKNVPDRHHIIFQLMSATPPSFWSQHFHEEPKVIIELFQKEKYAIHYVLALANAAIRFRDVLWVEALFNFAKPDSIREMLPSLLQVMPSAKAQEYAATFLDEKPREIIETLVQQGEEWSTPLAKVILKYTASEVYVFNKVFYRNAVAFIPVSMLHQLDALAPTDQQKRTYWENQSEELKRLLELKKQIIESFTL